MIVPQYWAEGRIQHRRHGKQVTVRRFGWSANSIWLAIALGVLSVCFGHAVTLALHRAAMIAKGGPEQAAQKHIAVFVDRHREWNVRVYRTPAGLRVLATHRTFSPSEPAVVEFFNALGTDPLYARMCFNQQCFRARISPKPWRIGIEQHMKPRPGVWPVASERLDARNAWIEAYETAAREYAACRLLETRGSGVVHPDVRIVQELHDEMARATSQLPIA